MKSLLSSILFLISISIFSQQLIIESGNLSLGSNTNLSVNQTSLTVNGSISSADSGVVIFTSDLSPVEISGNNEAEFGNLKINGDCDLYTNLTVKGNIIFSSGIFDLESSSVQLNGKLLGENETARAFASGGGQITTLVDLQKRQTINPGNLGLTITPSVDYSGFQIARGHESQINNSYPGINRYYSFNKPIDFSANIQFNFFEPEVSTFDKTQLKLWVQNENQWFIVDYSTLNASEDFATASVNDAFTKITLMESAGENSDVTIPTGFSPNGNGVNDLFVIEGALNFPNNRLTIFNQWGEVLFEKDGYNNDWGGEISIGSNKGNLLADGTYFYIFFKDTNDKKSVVKGFVEIKSGKK
jgi:gliding motility-associated-like protein